jgi:MFS family permease
VTSRPPAPRARARLLTPVFVLLMGANFAYFVSMSILTPILPRFVRGPLGRGDVAVGVVVGGFTVTALILRPFAGRLGDRRGRRPIIAVGAAAHAIGVAGMVVATSVPMAFGLRLLSGVGEAFFFVGAVSAINDLAPDERRGEAMSYFSLSLFLGLAVGPVAGEWALDALSYDAVWAIGAACALAAAVLGCFVPDTRPARAGGGAARLVHPAAFAPGLVLMLGVAGLSAFNAFVPLYAPTIGLRGSRLIFVVYSVVVLLYRSIGARIPDRVGAVPTARFAIACTTAGMATMGLWRAPAGLFVGTVLFASGSALNFPALMTIAVHGAPPSERGAVLGTFTAFFDLAFGVGALAFGAVADAAGYPAVFLTASAVAGTGFVVMLLRPPPDRSPVSLSEPVVSPG